MWLLLYISLTLDPGESIARETGAYLLDRYETETPCRQREAYVRYEMEKVYPNDPTFRIACRFYSVPIIRDQPAPPTVHPQPNKA